MSKLIVQLPAQPRLAAQNAQAAPTSAGGATEVEFVFSADGQHVTRQGRCALTELPMAQQVVAVMSPADIGWHRLNIPKAPGSRLRQALAGLLEEALLEDEGELHLALAPQAQAGQSGWVAAVSKPWLSAQIRQLEATGLTVDRVVPGWAPEGPPAAHVFAGERGMVLAWRDDDGPLCLPLASASARNLVAAQDPDQKLLWSASAEGAADAALLAGETVASQSATDFLQSAAASDWNLRQFDLAAQRRGQRAAREALQQVLTAPAWRPFRIGLLLLLVIQLLGANLWAWQARRTLSERKSALTSLVQATFPQVRAVFDAPIQMQKEIDLLRASAGKPGETDLEPLLYAADAAWPDGMGPADELRYESNKLTLMGEGWTAAALDTLRSRLRPLGLDAEAATGGVVIGRSRQPQGATAPVSARPASAPAVPAAVAPRPQPAPTEVAPPVARPVPAQLPASSPVGLPPGQRPGFQAPPPNAAPGGPGPGTPMFRPGLPPGAGMNPNMSPNGVSMARPLPHRPPTPAANSQEDDE